MITIEGIGEAHGSLVKIYAPLTVEAIAKKLPLEGRASLWENEVYFDISIKRGEEKARSSADEGDITYWPMGSALCVFYAPSEPYSPVNLVGKVESGIDLFRRVKSGTKIRVEIAKR